jgi:hypothetical protein
VQVKTLEWLETVAWERESLRNFDFMN